MPSAPKLKYGAKLSRDDQIKSIALAWHYPITDFKGLNAYIKRETGKGTTKRKIVQLMGY